MIPSYSLNINQTNMHNTISKKSALVVVLGSAFLVACGGSSSGGGDDNGGTSTGAIAGLWDLPDDTVLGFDLVEISSNGTFSNFSEDSVNNCYRTFNARLVNQGNNSYGYIGPTSDEVLISYTLVNEGDGLRYTSSFLSIDETWQAVTGVSTSDFNLCP